MKRIIALLLAICTCAALLSGCAGYEKSPATMTVGENTYNLLWSDEFNGFSLDQNKWGYELGGGGWGNAEYETYTNDKKNVSVSGGELHITAIKEDDDPSMLYSSGRLLTRGKFSFQYGYIEARLKMPVGQGLWPAFWMLGTTGQWPECGEIDIMEHINSENIVYATNHWNDSGHQSWGGSTANNKYNVFDVDVTEYHTYGLEWTEKDMTWYIDGTKYFYMFIEHKELGIEELHNEYYILLNLAVGGNWPGKVADATEFPAEYTIDYVRVYQ